MNTPHFVLRKKDNNYYFSNHRTKSENEFFNHKAAGIEILSEMIHAKVISKADAMVLLEKILQINDIPYGKHDAYNQFDSDMAAMILIISFRKDLREFVRLEKEPGLPKFKTCPNCGEHGQILGHNFLSIELYDKETAYDAVDVLIGDGHINRVDEKKIRKQIEESMLSQRDESKLAPLN